MMMIIVNVYMVMLRGLEGIGEFVFLHVYSDDGNECV